MSLATAYLVGWYALWLIAPLAQLFLAAVMLRRGLRKEFPLFFSYTAFQIAAFVLKFIFYHRSQLEYFYLYWTTSALSIVLGFAVIYEVFRHVFRPYSALRDMSAVLFKWAVLVLLLIAAVTAVSSPQPGAARIMQIILTLERSMRIAQCGLVLFLFMFAPLLGVSARHHMFGIALGFGVYGSVDLLFITLIAAGMPGGSALSWYKSAAYSLVVLLWIWYLASPEPARQPARYPIAERWNLAMVGAQQEGISATALNSLEATVDRVMTKTNGKNGNGNGNGNGTHH